MTRERWKRTKRQYQRYYISGTIKGSVVDWNEVERVGDIFIGGVRSNELFAQFTIYFKSGNSLDAKYSIDKRYKTVKGTFYGTNEVPYETQDYFNDKSKDNSLTYVRQLKEEVDKLFFDNVSGRVKTQGGIK